MARTNKPGMRGGVSAKPPAERGGAEPPQPPDPVKSNAGPARAQFDAANTDGGEASTPEQTVSSPVRASKDRSLTPAGMVAIVVGVIAVAVLAAAYILAPRGSPHAPANAGAAAGQVRASCTVAPDQTFNAPPGTHMTAFNIDTARACVNGRTPYEKTPAGFSRVITNASTDVVSTLDVSANLATLQSKEFLLSPKEFASLRAAIGSTASLKCSASDAPATVAENRLKLAKIRTLSQPYVARQPTRKITWRCSTLPEG